MGSRVTGRSLLFLSQRCEVNLCALGLIERAARCCQLLRLTSLFDGVVSVRRLGILISNRRHGAIDCRDFPPGMASLKVMKSRRSTPDNPSDHRSSVIERITRRIPISARCPANLPLVSVHTVSKARAFRFHTPAQKTVSTEKHT